MMSNLKNIAHQATLQSTLTALPFILSSPDSSKQTHINLIKAWVERFNGQLIFDDLVVQGE